MSQTFQPCCERTTLEVTDAPRTEGATPSPDVIRCAACGSTIPLEEISKAKRAANWKQKFGLRCKTPQTKATEKINHWL